MEFLIEHKVKADSADEAKTLRETFFAALNQNPDPEMLYRSMAKPDGVSFAHLGWFADQDALTRFQSTDHFKAFSSALPGVCEEGPQATPLTEILTTKG
jgi:quinol monooxygenase YgiN